MDQEEVESQAQGGMTRRQLLKAASATGLALMLPVIPHVMAADADHWVSVGKSADFVKDMPKKVKLDGGGEVYVTRLDDTKFIAVSDKCTHKGCGVDWDKDNNQFLCPCHGATYTMEGKVTHGPARRSLLNLEAMEKDGDVQVNLGGVSAAEITPKGGN